MILGVTLEELKNSKDDQFIAESFFAECGLPGTFKFEAFLHNWTQLLEKNLGVIWKLVLDGKIAGMIGGILSPDMLDGEMVATEAFWYVLPQHRNSTWGLKMLVFFESWARNVGAKRLVMAHLLSSFPESLSKYYERHGYKPVEVNYVKVL